MTTTASQITNKQQLLDWASGQGAPMTKDQRLQVKMPSALTKELDRLFPHQDRSEVITQLTLQAVAQKLRFIDRPDLAELVSQEQSIADEMFDYLEKRDATL